MTGHFNGEGVWVSIRGSRNVARTGLLLDRDGVLVEEVGYLSRPSDVRLERGAVDLLLWARQRGIVTAIVTNQSGIARGLLGWENYIAVEAEIDRQLAAQGLGLDAVIACPFHPDFTPSYGLRHDYWRKPGPGMLEKAISCLGLDPKRSWMLGDKTSDIVAADAAGLEGALLVRTGHGMDMELPVPMRHGFRTRAVADLPQAMLFLDEVFPA